MNQPCQSLIKLFSKVFAPIFLTLLSLTAAAEQISYQDYGALPDRSMFIVSPSGNQVAYRTTSDSQDFLVVVNPLQNKLGGAVDI